jgi:uncharacterized protein YrzB (UPF0473 family)
MKYKRIALFVFVVSMLMLTSCDSSKIGFEGEINVTPTMTSTPKPKVNCPNMEVNTYIEALSDQLEEWDDTHLVAVSTSRMSLAPIIGDLQEIKRNIGDIERPECSNYLNDIVIIAMESDIDALISFLRQDGDSIVSQKMAGADKAWDIVEEEFEKFKEAPLDAYYASNSSAEDIQNMLEEPNEFILKEDWSDINLPNANLVVSIPDDWETSTYGEENQFIKLTNSDETLVIMGGVLEDALIDIESDSGRLFSLQTFLETSDYDYYNERSADIEVFALNKAYVIEYSVRKYSGNDIKDEVIAYVVTPDEDVVMWICTTTRDEFAQIDIAIIHEIFGSIRK